LQVFRKSLKAGSSIYHINSQTHAKALSDVINRYPKALFVFGVAHPENAKLLEQLPTEQQSRLVIFNQDSESDITEPTHFRSVIEIGSLGSAPWLALSDELNRFFAHPEEANQTHLSERAAA